jgi:SRSO17 transposase
VEETSQFAKNDTRLDHYQVRRYDAWYRHITLSMLAAAFLAVTAYTDQLHDQKGTPHAAPSSSFPCPATKSGACGPA